MTVYEPSELPETEWDERYREMRRRPAGRRRTRPAGGEGARQRGGHLLLAVQVIGCSAVLLAALVLRLVGGEWFSAAQAWYWEHLNSSIVAQEDWDEVETRILELVPEGEAPQAESASAAP